MVFLQENDFEKFLRFLGVCSERFGWKLHHYVLMGNHYHMIIRNLKPKNLSDGLKWLNLSYAQYYRRRYGGIGHLWQDRFKSFVIQDGAYLLACGRYIERNPVRAGIVSSPENYRWSSYSFYAFGAPSALLHPSPEYMGLSPQQEARQRIYRQIVQEGRGEKRRLERYFRSRFYGDEGFRERLRRQGLRATRGWRRGPRVGRI